MVRTQGWELTIHAEADVIPGPLRRIRELCEQATEPIDPAEILAILDECEAR